MNLKELTVQAAEIAKLGGDSTLNFFKKGVKVESKADRSPVTEADRLAEELIRIEIRKRFPGHGIIGEEFGTESENSDIIWIIDPIDGTQSYIHGISFYTTLIGILVNGKPEVGIIYAPALGELVSASTRNGCMLNGEPVRVRECSSLSEATFLTTDVTNISEYKFDRPFQELLKKVSIHRTWGDAYGHLMVATGRADIMFDPILNIWDAAPLLTIITEAGGSFTDVSGNSTIETGNAISTNKTLKNSVLQFFNK